MKIETQSNGELEHLCELIGDIDVVMLANSDADGMLVSRPMTPLEMDRTGAIWFFTDLQSTKVEQLGVVNVSFVDVGRSIFVSMSGRSQLQTDQAHITRLWTPFAKPWFPNGPESPTLALLKFTPEIAHYWDSSHCKMVRMFAMVASIALGKPVGLGESVTMAHLSGGS